MALSPEDQLAAWRREGHGVWELTFIVEGYDDEFVHLVPGRLSKVVAEGLAAFQCAQELHTHRRFVHCINQRKLT